MSVVPGSSPLTRGKRLGRVASGFHRRLIPAHAGKTRPSSPSCSSTRAHPRSRGENIQTAVQAVADFGSSPLTRGKPASGGRSQETRGLIPAHAGKTSGRPCPTGAAGAHPRSRGENGELSNFHSTIEGSSPLTRGKLNERRDLTLPEGLIPAHAGKTTFVDPCHMKTRAHPRSRGENAASERRARAWKGSSPLTRGKHFLTCAFIAQIDQILESLELCAFSESYSSQDVYATDAPRDRVRSIDLGLRSSRGAS